MKGNKAGESITTTENRKLFALFIKVSKWVGHANVSTTMRYAHLEGANLTGAYLEGANLRDAEVDRQTNMRSCKIDRNTDLRDVNLELCKLDVGTKVLVEYNRRRMNWEDLYGKQKWHPRWMWRNTVVRGFWWLSDYGRSPTRIMGTFVILSVLFAGAYCRWPGLLEVHDDAPEIRNFLHALYFSVVTMTTLGFGDISANPDSGIGQILLMVQVIFGYVLLGALVAYLGIILTRDGPAGKFARTWKPPKKS